MVEISLLSPERYTLDELITDELSLEKIVTVETDGYLSVECFCVQEQKNVTIFFSFVFNGKSEFSQLYDRNGLTIYDLSGVKSEVISFDELENQYIDWLSRSGHENTMDEYGMLLGVVGFIERNRHRENLLAVVRDMSKA
ncbi:hypothetical protein CLV58_12946 [Spirosoma oryzae]|uniref:Uncharacterized protein n=1 Tax=Spirosoma oryzae TaxID=1469603 RepID=A0A2T0S556_9BACT|nr:hypothetical protein [Spirosoma oryzae]PRY28567.1 hypothetical protein CLV58_12946 [Spirosoma oryzae]